MFPINFNFPYRKKDGSLITMEKALDGAGADLDLIDLDDVAISNPAEGDGLIYDNTAHKWKNIPIISRILTLFNAWKRNGAFNSLPNNGVTQTAYGLTFTFNPSGYKRGVVHVSGTKSDADGHAVDMGTSLDTRVFTLKAGTYKILDGVSASNTNLGLELYNYTTDTLIKRTLNTHAEIFTLNEDTQCVCSIGYKGAIDTEFDDYIYPMITTDLNATPADYEPFAKTNGELTEELKTIPNGNSIFFTKATGGSIETNGSWAERYGKIIVVNLQVKFSESASSPTLGTLSIKPKYMPAAIVAAGGNLSTVSVNTSTGVISLNGNISSGWVYGQLVFAYE